MQQREQGTPPHHSLHDTRTRCLYNEAFIDNERLCRSTPMAGSVWTTSRVRATPSHLVASPSTTISWRTD